MYLLIKARLASMWELDVEAGRADDIAKGVNR